MIEHLKGEFLTYIEAFYCPYILYYYCGAFRGDSIGEALGGLIIRVYLLNINYASKVINNIKYDPWSFVNITDLKQ